MTQKLMSERHTKIVNEIIDSIRKVIDDNQVTMDEFDYAVSFLESTGKKEFEIPLMLQNFFQTTVCEALNIHIDSSSTAIQGPFFLEGAPKVANGGEIKTIPEDHGEPITIRGKVTNPAGEPLANVNVDIWHSTSNGTYSGVHPEIPADHYRVALTTDADGNYEVNTTKPVPYQIPHDGNTGELLAGMGRHSWRPAHIHFKLRGEGLLEHTTQTYFKGGDYVDSDCCQGVYDDLVHEFVAENGRQVITTDFVLVAA